MGDKKCEYKCEKDIAKFGNEDTKLLHAAVLGFAQNGFTKEELKILNNTELKGATIMADEEMVQIVQKDKNGKAEYCFDVPPFLKPGTTYSIPDGKNGFRTVTK